MPLPNESEILATGFPLTRTSLITICNGSYPNSLVSDVPIPKLVLILSLKAIAKSIAFGTVRPSEKTAVFQLPYPTRRSL